MDSYSLLSSLSKDYCPKKKGKKHKRFSGMSEIKTENDALIYSLNVDAA